jgi:hypothetical protein
MNQSVGWALPTTENTALRVELVGGARPAEPPIGGHPGTAPITVPARETLFVHLKGK